MTSTLDPPIPLSTKTSDYTPLQDERVPESELVNPSVTPHGTVVQYPNGRPPPSTSSSNHTGGRYGMVGRSKTIGASSSSRSGSQGHRDRLGSSSGHNVEEGDIATARQGSPMYLDPRSAEGMNHPVSASSSSSSSSSALKKARERARIPDPRWDLDERPARSKSTSGSRGVGYSEPGWNGYAPSSSTSTNRDLGGNEGSYADRSQEDDEEKRIQEVSVQGLSIRKTEKRYQQLRRAEISAWNPSSTSTWPRFQLGKPLDVAPLALPRHL